MSGYSKILLNVACRARDAEDCRLLLDALELSKSKPKRKGRKPKEVDHGDLLCYKRGCRCATCKAANRDRCASWRARARGDKEAADRAGHGNPSTYSNYGCRCAPCSAAQSQKMAAYMPGYRARQKAHVTEQEVA